jgi:hypothetical protein
MELHHREQNHDDAGELLMCRGGDRLSVSCGMSDWHASLVVMLRMNYGSLRDRHGRFRMAASVADQRRLWKQRRARSPCRADSLLEPSHHRWLNGRIVLGLQSTIPT